MPEATHVDDDDVAVDFDKPALVVHMEIRDLFGRYNYDIEVPLQARSDRLLLFYADNGKGKTTVLRLLWHLLSSANNRSHRTSISEVVFSQIRILLSDGAEIRASRTRPTDGPYVLRLQRNGLTVSETEWPDAGPNRNIFEGWDIDEVRQQLHSFPEEMQRLARDHLARREYLSYLENLQAHPYFLADDRNIYSDDLSDEPSRRANAIDALDYQRLVEGRRKAPNPEAMQGSVAQELEVSLRRATEMLRRMTLGANASGSASANSVYLEVLRRIGGTNPREDADFSGTLSQLTQQVQALGDRSRVFESLGLVPKFGSGDFIAVLRALPDQRISIAEEVLVPFVASLSARLDALQDAQSLLQTFLQETNGFLVDKELTFAPARGLRIRLHNGEPLRPTQLSSGERQLVLLLCNALLGRRGTRLFLIDEPELSLNVKWQRKIVPALLACTEGTSVQFLIATHSLELLSNYRSNVVTLTETST